MWRFSKLLETSIWLGESRSHSTHFWERLSRWLLLHTGLLRNKWVTIHQSAPFTVKVKVILGPRLTIWNLNSMVKRLWQLKKTACSSQLLLQVNNPKNTLFSHNPAWSEESLWGKLLLSLRANQSWLTIPRERQLRSNTNWEGGHHIRTKRPYMQWSKMPKDNRNSISTASIRINLFWKTLKQMRRKRFGELQLTLKTTIWCTVWTISRSNSTIWAIN